MHNPNLTYQSKDILRYLNGGMSNKEMHQFEMEALNDPFLQDAIDGFKEGLGNEDKATILSHLKAVENFEPQIIRKKNAAAIPLWQKNVLKYAAAAAIVSGAGWFIFNLSQPNKSIVNTTATVTTTVADTIQAKGAIPQPDLVVVPALPGANPVLPTAESKKPFISQTDKAAKKNLTVTPGYEAINQDDQASIRSGKAEADSAIFPAKDNLARTSTAPAGRSASNFQRPDAALKSMTEPQKSMVVNGKVLDNQKYPLDNITILEKGTKQAVVSDEMGRFRVAVPDTGVTLIASGLGYKTQEFKTDPDNKPLELELEKNEQSLSETVVIGYGTRKKKGITDIEMDTTDAAPAGGWDNFEKFVLGHKRVSRKGKPPMKVVLSFEINRKGRPDEFDIIESGGKPYDDEAIRLLKTGPAWINKSSENAPMAKITIVFN